MVICNKHGELIRSDIGKNEKCLLCNRERRRKFNAKKSKIIKDEGFYEPSRRNKNNKSLVIKECKRHGLLNNPLLVYIADGNKRCKLCLFEDRRAKYFRENKGVRLNPITVDQFLHLFSRGYSCEICGKDETIVVRRDGKPNPLSVDHCHKTGEIRGLLCFNCNRSLGGFKESEDILIGAINYIRRYTDGST